MATEFYREEHGDDEKIVITGLVNDDKFEAYIEVSDGPFKYAAKHLTPKSEWVSYNEAVRTAREYSIKTGVPMSV